MKNRIPILALSIALATSLLIPLHSLAGSFSDVPADYPYYKQIEFLKTEGIIGGYPDGTFKPGQVVNRAEALKIILNAAKIQATDATKTSFSDVQLADWFAKFVETAKAKGIVNGNPDGTFAPARNVNKVEYLKMLLLAFDVKFVNYKAPADPLYPDTTDSSQWFIPYLDFAKNVNMISPDSAGNIEPTRNLTRGEVADIAYKLIIIIKGGPVQLDLSRAEAQLIQSIYDLQNNKLESAHTHVASAKTLAQDALSKAPNESIVKAAVKVIEAFESLITAFQQSAANKNEDALKSAGSAYNLAEDAKNINSGISNLSDQVKAASKSLADSIRARQ